MVGQPPENEGADGAQGQGHRQRQGDSGNGDMKLRRNVRKHECQDEEIKGIQRPAQKAARHRMTRGRCPVFRRCHKSPFHAAWCGTTLKA